MKTVYGMTMDICASGTTETKHIRPQIERALKRKLNDAEAANMYVARRNFLKKYPAPSANESGNQVADKTTASHAATSDIDTIEFLIMRQQQKISQAEDVIASLKSAAQRLSK